MTRGRARAVLRFLFGRSAVSIRHLAAVVEADPHAACNVDFARPKRQMMKMQINRQSLQKTGDGNRRAGSEKTRLSPTFAFFDARMREIIILNRYLCRACGNRRNLSEWYPMEVAILCGTGWQQAIFGSAARRWAGILSNPHRIKLIKTICHRNNDQSANYCGDLMTCAFGMPASDLLHL